MTTTTSAFDLPERLSAKSEPALIADDEQRFAGIAACLEQQAQALAGRLAALRLAPGGSGQQALDRDQEIHRLSANLRVLNRFGLDVCLGRMVPADGKAVYIGRLGLTGQDGTQLLIDWRAPAAEPFFAATRANPMGLVSRRRYRWTGGRITDFWDEVLVDGNPAGVAPDDESAFIASLGASRSPHMRDVLATLQADQDAVVRAPARGALVIHGGPGTGKTVVALHRAAYLLYTDPLLDESRGGVLFVGPHHEFLSYVADVLPSLGEEGVRTCTLRDMVAEGAAVSAETDPRVARLKASADMVAAIEPAVALSEKPPTKATVVEAEWFKVRVDPEDWAEAFAAPDPGTPHNEARDEIWAELLDILVDKAVSAGAAPRPVRASLSRNADLSDALNRAWPLIEPADLIADLWSVPAYLRRCAPWLTPEDVTSLQRADPYAWTTSDLPLLDAARHRLGNPASSRLERTREAAAATERDYMDDVVQNLLDADDGEGLVTMLLGEDLRDALVDPNALPAVERDPLAGPFAHIVVDEAQELTDAEWQMLLRRCPSRSLTVVGDRAQARNGFAESWRERLERVGFGDVAEARLDINYRTPREVMAEARPVIEAVLPDADVPTSVRSSGLPVVRGSVGELPTILDEWLAAHGEGLACVIGYPAFDGTARVMSLDPEHAKGLEFDLVILVDPDAFGSGVQGGVDRYVAMTRATQQLVVLTSKV